MPSPTREPVLPPNDLAALQRSPMDQVIARSPIGIAVIDHDGIYRSVNPAYCALVGHASDDLLGYSFLMVLPPAQQARTLALHQQFLSAGGELKGEWEVLRRDGTRLNVLSESVQVPGDDGRPCRLVYVLDITQRKRVELALGQAKDFLRSVLDGLAAHVCVLDDKGTVVAVNRAWREFAEASSGRAEAVHEGANYLRVCERAALIPGPDGQDAERFLGLLREVLAGRLQKFQFEYPCHSPTEHRWFVAHVAHIDGSQPPCVVVAHDDVTPLKRVQQALAQREALMLDIAESIPGALFRLAQPAAGGWHIDYVSPGIEALCEVTAEQACSDRHALLDCVLPDDRQAHEASVRQALAQRGPWEHGLHIRTRSGQVKWVHARAQPKPDGHGGVVWTGVLSDVSERERIASALRASEATYRTLFESVPQGIVYHDLQGRITSANPAAQRILGLSLEQLMGKTPADPHWAVVREDGSDFPGDQHPAMQVLQTGRPVVDVVMGVNVPGRGRAWILVNATPVLRDGRLAEVYATFEDISQRVRMTHELARQASTDHLTGAANRRCLMERLGTELERIRRHPGLHCSILAIDLDLFKLVNDQWGHAAGDAALVHVTQLMRQESRALDLVSRSGGEEFILLLPDTDADDAMALAERLRRRLAGSPLQHAGQPIALSISIGVSVITATDTSIDNVLARADRALYEAKSDGRNAVRLRSGGD